MVIQHGGGLIDPVSAVNATGSSTLNYRCMTGVSPQFDIDASGTFASPKTVTAVLTDGTNNMNADITMTATGGAGTGLGGGQDKVGTISGLITPASFQVAVPSTYSKTVTIDIQAIP
jgi:nicotinamide mononucleotide (NMN) deamidase PncC